MLVHAWSREYTVTYGGMVAIALLSGEVLSCGRRGCTFKCDAINERRARNSES